MNANQRIRIDTGGRVESDTSNVGAWVTASTETRWCEASVIAPAQAIARYDVAIDKELMYEFRFYDRPTITMRDTRFVWVTDGNPNELKIYWPKSTPINADGEGRVTTVLVTEDNEKKAEEAADD